MREDVRRGIDVDESPLAGEWPEAYAMRMACAKAQAAARYLDRRTLLARPVLAADTTVRLCEGLIIGKPADREDAVRILKVLSGRQHEVVTAVALAVGDRLEHAVSIS